MTPASRSAAFLDRDGTLIHDAHYLRDPALLRIIDGVPAALRTLRDAGYALIVVTNQSGIARGLLSEADYEAVRARLDALLAEHGITLDASYHCPHEPSISGPCYCRKPGTLLYRQAIERFGIDATRSAFIGDRWRDVAPGLELGGTGVLIPGANTPAEDITQAERNAAVARTLAEAVSLVLAGREA